MNRIVQISVTAALAAGLGFSGGLAYGRSDAASAQAARFDPQAAINLSDADRQAIIMAERGSRLAGGQGNRIGLANGATTVTGTVREVTAGFLTIDIGTEGTRLVIVTDRTEATRPETILPTDLRVGDRVTAIGQTETDGSLVADSIQVRMGDNAMIPARVAPNEIR